jgi:exopolysaccharide production protein ExoY
MTAHFNSLNDAVLADVWEGRVETAYRPGLYRNVGKRVFEATLVLLSLPVVLPLILLLALPMVLRGESPFYTQRRVGRGGRTFVMWKLRSMVADADERLARYLRETPRRAKNGRGTRSCAMIPALPPTAGSFARRRSTSFRSSSTCCSGTWLSSGRAR